MTVPSITSATVFLPEDILHQNGNTIAIAYPGDIIIAKGGNTLAKVGLITNEYEKYAICRDVIVLRTNNLIGINKYYLWAFLHCAYGQGMLWRSASQTGQPHLTLPAIYSMKIPEYSFGLQNRVEQLYKISVNLKADSVNLYSHAEQLLYNALGMSGFLPIEESVSIRSFNESFISTGRIDAEYYQSKYQVYEEMLNTRDTVKTLCNVYDNNYVPKDDTNYMYIELSNVGSSGNIFDVEKINGKDLPSRARRRVKKGQVIVSSIEGSLQSCALITDDLDGALCSTGFYVIDSFVMSSETLLILFKSKPIQALLKRRCSGTILTAINKDEFMNLPLARIDANIQRQISEEVMQSFAFRRRSEQLLEISKHAIEIAIEQGEEMSMKLLIEKEVDC